jgi:hypothetical protein
MVDRITSWARRSPGLAAALATLLAGGLLVGGWLGMQAAARRALLAAGRAEIGENREELARIEGQLMDVDRQLDADRLQIGERVRLEVERAGLRAERAQVNERMRAMFAALLGLTSAAPDPEVQREAREHMLAVVQRRLVESDPFRAKATVEWLLEGASRRNPLGFDRQQRKQLQVALAQAEAAIQEWERQLRERLAGSALPPGGAAR